MKLYISGPITGLEDGNGAAFATAERVLKDSGYEVVNPHALKLPLDVDWHVAMRQCVALLAVCDGVALLEGWTRSDGAQLEQWLASALAIESKELGEWLLPAE